MTALQTLQRLGRATAAKVAEVSGIDLTFVYVDLVAAEAHCLCFVQVSIIGGKTRREWVAA